MATKRVRKPKKPAPTQDAAVVQAFVAGTLPEDDRRAPDVVLVEDTSPAVPDLAATTAAILGRRGAVAEQDVRDVLTAAAKADPAQHLTRFAHEVVRTPDGESEYFDQSGNKIDPADVILP